MLQFMQQIIVTVIITNRLTSCQE